tara:strand:+ start:162 stop:638 length:477 start_codon:yes stop_codon:yes gene_type:complete
MLKKLFFTSFLISSIVTISYPSKNENTSLLDYCYSLEKIISRNSIKRRKNISGKVKSISEDLARVGISKSKGTFTNNMIDQYKTSKNNLILNLIPNNFLCFSGYWIEKIKPGIFESIIYEKSKKRINELKDFKDEVDELINNINSEYKNIKGEFNSLF